MHKDVDGTGMPSRSADQSKLDLAGFRSTLEGVVFLSMMINDVDPSSTNSTVAVKPGPSPEILGVDNSPTHDPALEACSRWHTTLSSGDKILPMLQCVYCCPMDI